MRVNSKVSQIFEVTNHASISHSDQSHTEENMQLACAHVSVHGYGSIEKNHAKIRTERN